MNWRLYYNASTMNMKYERNPKLLGTLVNLSTPKSVSGCRQGVIGVFRSIRDLNTIIFSVIAIKRFFVKSHTCTFLFVNSPFLPQFTKRFPLGFAEINGKTHGGVAVAQQSTNVLWIPARRNHLQGSELFPNVSAPR